MPESTSCQLSFGDEDDKMLNEEKQYVNELDPNTLENVDDVIKNASEEFSKRTESENNTKSPQKAHTPKEYERVVERILQNEGYESKENFERAGINLTRMFGFHVHSSEDSDSIYVKPYERLIPDFVKPSNGGVADAKFYHTLKNTFGSKLTDKSWYSNPSNQEIVKTKLHEQLLNYSDVQKRLQTNNALQRGEEADFFEKQIPDPPITLVFPEPQAEWLTNFIKELPGINYRVIDPALKSESNRK